MRAAMTIVVIAAILSATMHTANAEVQTGTISSDFKFIAKFCFHQSGYLEPAGSMEVTVDAPQFVSPGNDQSDMQLVIYDDQPGRWENFLSNQNDWDCPTKVANANAAINATSMTVNGDGTVTLSFVPLPFSESTRPRFWFFSLARCNGGGFVNAAFHSHALQLGQSDWNHEFSEDQNGLNSLYLSFFFMFTALVVINCIGTYKLQQRLSYLHPMIKLFLIVLVLEYISVFVLLLHYGSFAQNGTGIVELLKVGEILSIASRCFFMLLLLFLAKGWTISHETLTRKWAVVGLVVLYLILDITILLYSMYDADPKRTTPSRTLLALSILVDVVWLGFTAWFAVEIFGYSYRLEDNPAKRSMYLKLGLLFLPWLLLPVLVSFAVFALDPWVRIRIVRMFQVGITWLAYAALAFLFWPSRAEEAFSISTPDVMSVGGRSQEDYATL